MTDQIGQTVMYSYFLIKRLTHRIEIKIRLQKQKLQPQKTPEMLAVINQLLAHSSNKTYAKRPYNKKATMYFLI